MFSFQKKTETPQKQYSLHDGTVIFTEIKTKLSEAKFSIKVAAAWFTDEDLFQNLLNGKSANPNLSIEIVLDDNKENRALRFMDLVTIGCTVKLAKGIGPNGRMHQKFCIVDDRVLINGSYNWSKNARTNNHESVIVSEIQTTIDQFNTKFQQLLESSVQYDHINLPPDHDALETVESVITDRETFSKAFEKVLDEMIYSSVIEYDKNTLTEKGFDRSEKCAGDSNIINNELDTVYTEMLNSISSSERKKEIIKARVATHLQEASSSLREKLERQKEQIRVESDNFIDTCIKEINFVKDHNQTLKEEILKIENSDVINNANRIEELTAQKMELERETVKMPFRWYIDVPTYIGLFGVFTYIVLFYSSAAYILMFSEQDAKTQIILGQPVDKMGIFLTQAIPRASGNGLSQLLIILLVPLFLVCGIIYLKKLKTKPVPKWAIKLICLLLIDGLTAFAVTRSIHENNYIAGIEKEHFIFANLFSDMNFYLVFLFGMFSLLVFDLILSYILKNFESRNDVHLKAKKQTEIHKLNEEISQLLKSNVELATLATKKKEQIHYNLQTISSIEKDIQLQPGYTGRKINLLENETNSQITNLENIVKIAENKLDNELFNFSTHFIKDRINIFLQGWNNFIYGYYAKAIAERKVQDAKMISSNWFQTHFSKELYTKTATNGSV